MIKNETERPELPKGVRLLDFKNITDHRGSLCVVQREDLPFPIKRIFWIYDVPMGKERGSHAHRTCTEIIVPIHGNFKLTLTDGTRSCTMLMDSPDKGVMIPPMVWCELSDFTAGCVCLCLASHDYDVSGYINDFEEFTACFQ